MNLAKQHRKLHKLLSKAEICLTRDEAKKILKKAAKTQRKLEMGATPTDWDILLRKDLSKNEFNVSKYISDLIIS